MINEIPPSVEKLFDKLIDSNDIWIVQTYIHLKRRGLNVHLTSDYVKNQICVTSYEQLVIRDLCFNSYIIACRHDRGRPEICQQRIVQNKLNLVDHTDHYIPHWPQPNLKSRDLTRNNKIENLTYKGRIDYLAEPFRSEAFLNDLKKLGVNLILSSVDEATQLADWTDYTQADLALAVRNCTEYDLSIKPPSKLINAWLSGCPALLGNEPAYWQLRQSELDYIEINSPHDVIESINRLRSEPKLYQAMVENGWQRGKEFTADALSLKWRNLFATSITQGYEEWKQQSLFKKTVIRPIQFAQQVIKHKQEKQKFFKGIHEGSRPF